MADAPPELYQPCPHLDDVGGAGGFSTGVGGENAHSWPGAAIGAFEGGFTAYGEQPVQDCGPMEAALVSPPSGPAFIKVVLEQIKQRQQQRRQLSLFEDSLPPDERYFGSAPG